MINKLYENVKNYIIENYKSLLFFLVLILIFVVKFPLYISAPGGTIDTKDRINMSNEFKLKGSLNMAYVTQLDGKIPFLIYAFFNPSWDIEKESKVVIGSESIRDEQYRNKLLLKEANNTAILVAYDYSGISYETENNKVYVTYIDDLSKTDLKVTDQVIKVDNVKVTEKKDLYDYIKTKKIGDKVNFIVLSGKKEKKRQATLIDASGEAKVGVLVTETFDIKSDYHTELTFKSSESGSSGGFMMSLALYGYLNKIDLTNGKKIIGTGTINKDGTVGQISGIKYKLMGAVKEKCDIFLVPQGKNYKEARKIKKEKGYDILIEPIETFDEAIKYLNKNKVQKN